MFDWFKDSPEEVALKKAILTAFAKLSVLDPTSPQYSATADQLVKLMKLQKEVNPSYPSWMPSPDALIGVLGTVGTAFLVLNYESLGVVTSKAFGFVRSMIR